MRINLLSPKSLNFLTSDRGLGAAAWGPLQTFKAVAAACALAVAFVSPAFAQESDSPLKSVAKLLGFATDVAPPADFVETSRAGAEKDYIPIFRPPPEPAKPVLNKDQFNALKSDLDSTEKSHNAARAAFPPSAKAVAEADAAKKKAAAKSASPKQ
jgi:hypothetical protein